jgi:hypothetical protein
MKALKWSWLWVLIATATWVPGAAEDPADVPLPVPSDVQLRNGAVLHHVTVVRWEKDRVVLKHAGGADPIRYADIADSQREAIMARGRYELSHPPTEQPAAAAPAEAVAGSITYKGQVSVPIVDPVTKLGGVYNFPGVTVYAFPLSALEAIKSNEDPADVPRPLATATTKEDGTFTLVVPPDAPHFIYCQAGRIVSGGRQDYAWCVDPKDLKDPAAVMLGVKYRMNFRHLRIAE